MLQLHHPLWLAAPQDDPNTLLVIFPDLSQAESTRIKLGRL